MSERTNKVRTPLFPLYSEVRQLLNILEGVPRANVKRMLNSIWEQTGTPQNPVDWSDPDTWIAERLSGEEAELARRIWKSSNRTVNPRYIYGSYLFISNYELLTPDSMGAYQITERGSAFLDDDATVIRELDDAEGLLRLLGILATKSRAKRGDLLPEWGDFLREYSKFGTVSTIKDTLRRRLRNLTDRGLVQREGNTYIISKRGLSYAATSTRAINDPRSKVTSAVSVYNDNQRELLRERLSTMSPYRFEHLVRELLEAMGYEDVTVTKESGDKGVDVVATVQFGITAVTEVVQVKRHQGNISRPTLDQLRGALPYHEAIRGTLITLGGFSKGCTEAALYPGAAPITLINGDKLLELLIEHGIGIRKRDVTLYELDEDYFEAPDEYEQVGEIVDSEAAYWITPVKSDEEQTAEEVIQRLVKQEQIYAFGKRTPGRKHIKPDDWICFYATAKGVVAHARVASVPERREHPKVRHPEEYPWVFDLENAQLYLDDPVVLDLELRGQLDAFRDKDLSKRWAWYVQATRKVTEQDFSILTRQNS